MTKKKVKETVNIRFKVNIIFKFFLRKIRDRTVKYDLTIKLSRIN